MRGTLRDPWGRGGKGVVLGDGTSLGFLGSFGERAVRGLWGEVQRLRGDWAGAHQAVQGEDALAASHRRIGIVIF